MFFFKYNGLYDKLLHFAFFKHCERFNVNKRVAECVVIDDQVREWQSCRKSSFSLAQLTANYKKLNVFSFRTHTLKFCTNKNNGVTSPSVCCKHKMMTRRDSKRPSSQTQILCGVCNSFIAKKKSHLNL